MYKKYTSKQKYKINTVQENLNLTNILEESPILNTRLHGSISTIRSNRKSKNDNSTTVSKGSIGIGLAGISFNTTDSSDFSIQKVKTKLHEKPNIITELLHLIILKLSVPNKFKYWWQLLYFSQNNKTTDSKEKNIKYQCK